MESVELKLKQASAVLGTNPKELQNLVQFGVLRPKRKEGVFLFDNNALCTARLALYLKQAFGTKTDLLTAYAEALAGRMPDLLKAKPTLIVLLLRFPKENFSLECRVPFRKMANEVAGRIKRATFYRDLPRGRKRRTWKKEFLDLLKAAGKDLGDISEAEILSTVRNYRKEKRTAPEITVVAEA